MIYFNNASAWTKVYLGNTEYSKVYSSEALVFPATTPPTPTFSGKVQSWFNDYTTSSATCDSGTYGLLTNIDTAYGGGMARMQKTVSAVVGTCVTATTDAFSNCLNLTSVTLPQTLITLGDRTFYHCELLTSIDIPSGVTSIGEQAFQGCSGLTSITIPSGVTTIPLCMCDGCSSMTSITMPNGITSIGISAFYGCSGLTSITIPSAVTNIEINAFDGCSSLTSVTIPSGVTSIGDVAFGWCTSLQSVTCLATTPPTLGEYAFSDTNECPIYVPCSAVDAYKAASGWSAYASRIEAIQGSCGFNGKVMLEFPSHYVPSAVTADCSSSSVITSQEISDLITGGSKTALRAITIGSCATEVGYRAFIDYTSATSLTFEEGNLTTIGERAFDNCKSLTSVTLPNTVTSVATGAFRDCSAMTHFSFSTAMTAIPDDMFYQDYSLSSVTIPSGITSIGDGAFQQCTGLTSIVIPSGVTSIGTSAFYYCRNLASITCLASTPPTLGTSTFNGSTCPIYVPSASVNTYKAASGWSSYASRIQAIPNS